MDVFVHRQRKELVDMDLDESVDLNKNEASPEFGGVSVLLKLASLLRVM